ncbi:MAG: Rieske (2Fe-2S) protein [Planctomycetota bacterium]
MRQPDNWIDDGAAGELRRSELQVVRAGNMTIALSCIGGEFGAISNACNHVGGPLGEGSLDRDFVVCPWHQWKFHRVYGTAEPGRRGNKTRSRQ